MEKNEVRPEIVDIEHFKNFWIEQQKTAKHMDRDAALAHIVNFINNHNTCALATGTGDFVRCTPIEYTFMDDCFYLYSEGGAKFIGLEKNLNVSLSIFEYYGDKNDSHGLQVMGKAELFPPRCELFKKVLAFKGIPYDVMKAAKVDVCLIRIIPQEYEMYDTDFVKAGFDVRQIVRFSMAEQMLKMIDGHYPLKEREAGEAANAVVNGMQFNVRAFDAEGLGNVSLMHGGVPGVMSMDTIVVNPFDRDMALFSYDRIDAGGMDTLFLEMYDTRLGHQPDTAHLAKIVEAFGDLQDSPIAPNWYDDILFKESVKKVGPKALTKRMDEFTVQYLGEYLRLVAEAPLCSRASKKKAAAAYTEGLLTHGGPSTDVFVKAKGIEFTTALYRETLFGTGDPE